MAIKVAINGFGRIGRLVFRVAWEREELDVVAINDITDAKTLAHLLKYDSVHGILKKDISYTDDSITVDGKVVKIYAERNPGDLPWKELGIDLVVESTGIFRTNEKISKHLEAGAKKVILTVPAKDEIDGMFVLGVNDEDIKGDEKIVSNASCTTNCVAPMAKVLHDNFGIKRGWMTTTHAYTNDQRLLDLPHSDLRRSRAAAMSIIPTTTGAARAVGKIIKDLAGKLDGISLRVPTPCSSIVDLVVDLEKNATPEEINKAMKEAAEGRMKGYLEYSEDPLVSIDITNNPHSCVFDSLMTSVMDGNFIKIIGWYDNEWGYSNRVVDLAVKIS